MSFKDHFSGHAADYSRYRPRYPEELFSRLAGLCTAHELAWDCATGSGQAARSLARHFRRVVATDASEQQLQNAAPHPAVEYRVALAEDSGLPATSVDLLSVAQALHWFDIPAFGAEAERVLKPGGVLAVWTYGVLRPGPGLDELLHRFHHDIVGPYWPFERSVVESGYAAVEMPLAGVAFAPMEMTEDWRFDDLLGYLNTWSSVKAYAKDRGHNPVTAQRAELLRHWGDPDAPRTIRWPLIVRAWRKVS